MEIKFITLKSLHDKQDIFINVNHIGHFYSVPEKNDYGRIDKPKHTRVGVTTHNNGGFEVWETPEQIINLIKKCNSKNK